MVNTLFNLVLSTLVVVVSLTFGRLLLGSLGFRPTSLSEEIVLATGLGLACLVYTLVLLGVFGMLYPVTAWALLIGGAAAGGLWWLRDRSSGMRLCLPRIRTPRLVLWPVVTLLLAYMAVYAMTALSPTLEGDSTAGYLLVAREYARRHSLALVDYAYVTSFHDSLISYVNIEDMEVEREIETALGSVGIIARPDGRYLYVTNVLGKSISVIDTVTNEVVDDYYGLNGPRWVEWIER